MAVELIERNPALKKPSMMLLSLCFQEPDEERAALEEAAAKVWDGSFRQSPAAMVDILVRNGLIAEQMLLNGAPYEGTIEDMQLDPEVDEEFVVESSLSITDEGIRLLEEYAPRNTMARLFVEKPQYVPTFKATLEACRVEGGCGRVGLENAIDDTLPRLEEEGGRTVYAQYFIDALESAGGIEWSGAWRTTDAGIEALGA